MTKKEIITAISDYLMLHPEKEICVVKYQNKLRNGRWGLHAFTIYYQDMAPAAGIYCRPWAGANLYWRAGLERLKKTELLEILNRSIISR